MPVRTFPPAFSHRWSATLNSELKWYVRSAAKLWLALVIVGSVRAQSVPENIMLKDFMCGDEAASVLQYLDVRYPVRQLQSAVECAPTHLSVYLD
jgi:hypothetical protein